MVVSSGIAPLLSIDSSNESGHVFLQTPDGKSSFEARVIGLLDKAPKLSFTDRRV